MTTVGRIFKPAASILGRVRSAARLSGSLKYYQALRVSANVDQKDPTKPRSWTQCSLYYCISFLSNVLLILCSLSGYIISGDRDSEQATNCARFFIVGIYALPTVVAMGFVVFSYGRAAGVCQTNENSKENANCKSYIRLHTKLAIFCTLNSALSFIFMDIYALGFDDPDTRFGTRDDVRNGILNMIIFSSALSFLSLLISLLINFYACAKGCHEMSPNTETMQSTEYSRMERGDSPSVLKQSQASTN